MLKDKKNWYAFGAFLATIDQSHRLRLGKTVHDTLKKKQVNQLWLYPDSNNSKLILCPPEHQESYRRFAQKHSADAIREKFHNLTALGHPVTIDKQGRINIPTICAKLAGITPGDTVVIEGAEKWYEVWVENNNIQVLKKQT